MNPRSRCKPCAKCGAIELMYGRQFMCRPCKIKLPKTPEELRKRAAQVAVREAVRKGLMSRQPCVACILGGHTQSHPSHGHHEDYSKPLDVIWLCPFHHHTAHQSGLEYVMRSRAAA